MDTTGGGKGAAKSGAGNDDGGTDESVTGTVPIVGVGPLDEAEGEGGVGRDSEEELLFTLGPDAAIAGECDGGAPAEEGPVAVAEGGIVGGQPGGPDGGKLLPLELVVVLLPDASEGLG